MHLHKLFPILAAILLLLCALIVTNLSPSQAFATSNTGAIQAHTLRPLACPPTIGEGNAGSLVKSLQSQLNTLYGYGEFTDSPYQFDPLLAVDGIFGPLTRNAVMDFQSANHLQVDGIVGPQTWHILARC